jgi:hypothetical protein
VRCGRFAAAGGGGGAVPGGGSQNCLLYIYMVGITGALGFQ